jgi:hypothetical protein
MIYQRPSDDVLPDFPQQYQLGGTRTVRTQHLSLIPLTGDTCPRSVIWNGAK